MATEKRKLVREIRKQKYDCAIELYSFFPNTIPILWRAKIPLRIGFNTGGNSFLLSKSVNWKGTRYIPFHYCSLLDKIGVSLNSLRPEIIVSEKISTKLEMPYLIFHAFSAFQEKELPIEFWNTLCEFCEKSKIKYYFTGRGTREKKITEIMGVKKADNLCDLLSWPELIKTIQKSRGLVSVDSVPVHLAAALDVPFAVLYKRATKIWQPESTRGKYFGMPAPININELFEIILEWTSSKSKQPEKLDLSYREGSHDTTIVNVDRTEK